MYTSQSTETDISLPAQEWHYGLGIPISGMVYSQERANKGISEEQPLICRTLEF
jgi:hypothetical protein